MTMGPVQMLVLGFEEGNFTGEIMEEVRRLREHDVIRLVDLMFVTKDEDGSIDAALASDLSQDEAEEFGAIIGALVGFGMAGEEGAEAGAEAGIEALEDGHVFDEDEVWYVADTIPPGSSAAIALIEHRWAIPLREAIIRAGGVALADEWVHPQDLIAVGAAAAAE
jgi:uncharacterized membrane protein